MLNKYMIFKAQLGKQTGDRPFTNYALLQIFVVTCFSQTLLCLAVLYAAQQIGAAYFWKGPNTVKILCNAVNAQSLKLTYVGLQPSLHVLYSSQPNLKLILIGGKYLHIINVDEITTKKCWHNKC